MLLLQEEWGGGIPAKAWDSAFAIAEHLRRRPDLLSGQERLLDLSSGNALLGLLVSRLAPGKEVFVTDLPEALDLPRLNAERNGGGVEVRGLDWYAPADSGIGPRSVGFAILSDLLYENEHFPALLGALDYLIRDGGRILVGYKRRGLTEVEESEFWESLGKGFAEVVDERELDPPGMEGSGVELRLFQR
ncbi:nicotinamide N-methyltransferase-like protein [Hyaloraphidium curvatum]|nr:nicotinamide N-methyltransferase-like protein [Hyaloraphidium curvatum]